MNIVLTAILNSDLQMVRDYLILEISPAYYDYAEYLQKVYTSSLFCSDIIFERGQISSSLHTFLSEGPS